MMRGWSYLPHTSRAGVRCDFCGVKIDAFADGDVAAERELLHEGKVRHASECKGVPYPGFCHRLPECAGRGSCPREYACID